MPNKKIVRIIVSAIAALFLSSCSSFSELSKTKAASTATPSFPKLKTTMGDFAIVSAHLVDEVHDSQAPDGSKFLLIGLAHSDLQKLVFGEFPLEDFHNTILESSGEIYVLGKDGSQTFYSNMGGWVEEDFVLGFTVPLTETYTLYWPNNDPIPLQVKE